MELLPCPFCGSTNLGQTEHRYSSEIYCHECNGSCDSEKWNNRHSLWISVIKNFIEEVEHHRDNGHKEISVGWILNKLKEKEI